MLGCNQRTIRMLMMLTCQWGSVSVIRHDWFKDNAFDVAPLIKLILYFVYSQCWLQEASAYRPGAAQQSPEEKRSEWFQWFRRASKPGDCLQTSQSFWCTSDRRAWLWSWLWMSQTLPCSRMTGHVPGPLEPEEEGRQCQIQLVTRSGPHLASNPFIDCRELLDK